MNEDKLPHAGSILEISTLIDGGKRTLRVLIKSETDTPTELLMEFTNHEDYSKALAFWIMAKSLSDYTIGLGEDDIDIDDIDVEAFLENLDLKALNVGKMLSSLASDAEVPKPSSPFFGIRSLIF